VGAALFRGRDYPLGNATLTSEMGGELEKNGIHRHNVGNEGGRARGPDLWVSLGLLHFVCHQCQYQAQQCPTEYAKLLPEPDRDLARLLASACAYG
jgi:hypothetical protein